MKTIEYLLWNNCPNNCLFCNMKDKYQSNEEDKLKAIKLVKENIKERKERFNVLLVGGEIFMGLTNRLKEKLIDLYHEIFRNDLINIIYINTNLLYYIPDCLEKILDKAPIERIHLTTSDDIQGRFKTENDFKLFFDNIDFLRFKYPKLEIIVNTILTRYFYNFLLSGKYNIKEYCNKYKVKVNIIPYIDINNIEELKLTKKEIIKALLILKEQYPEWFEGYIDIMTKKNDMELLQYSNKTKSLMDVTTNIGNCGHSTNFTLSIKNSNKCFACLLEEMR